MAKGNRRRSKNVLAQFPVDFPTGSILAFGGETAPEGWVLCDGSMLDRTQYASLFAAIGTAHGEGDGSTTFHVPDYRGRFLRGVDNGAGRDADAGSRTAANTGGNTGDAVGAVQGDAMRNFTGSTDGSNGSGARGYMINGTRGVIRSTQSGVGRDYASGGTNGFATDWDIDPSREVPTGADNRPVNANVNYIIKL